ncbi:MAG TPA: hypothetical protein DCF62_12350 [Porticoccaceae bacterium]|nr:hypothetical protein [Porticoccaceae bacterium]HCO59756.1 hypothetical protein [Porticoccaceae bacterium]
MDSLWLSGDSIITPGLLLAYMLGKCASSIDGKKSFFGVFAGFLLVLLVAVWIVLKVLDD